MENNSLTSKGFRAFTTSVALSASLFFSVSCGDALGNISIPGVDGPYLSIDGDNVKITSTLEGLNIDQGFRFAIPEYAGSYIELSPSLDADGTLLSISVSITDLLDDSLQLLEPQSLPGGRSLPGVASGKLPAVAFTVNFFKNMSFYLGPKFFGVFIPISIDLGGPNNIISSRFYTDSIRAGTVSIVGKDINGENSGFLLLLDLTDVIKSNLRNISERSELQ